MPAASVLANPLWKLHEEEVHAWADPSWSAPMRVSALKHKHVSEMQMADSLSQASEYLLQPIPMPAGLDPDVREVHISKNICYFEHLFRTCGDYWGNPCHSPLRKGFRTAGPVEPCALWDACDIKKASENQKFPSYEEAIDTLAKPAKEREPAPFEDPNTLEQGWSAAKEQIASGVMNLHEIDRPTCGIIIYSFYLAQRWSAQLNSFTKYRLIANERPKNKLLSPIERKLCLPSHKYILSLLHRALLKDCDEDHSSIKERALESLRIANKQAPLKWSELEPPLKKLRASPIIFQNSPPIQAPQILILLAVDAHSTSPPKPYRPMLRNINSDLNPYSTLPQVRKVGNIHRVGNLVLLFVRQEHKPPSKVDSISDRVSALKTCLDKVQNLDDFSVFTQVAFPGALATSSYGEHLASISSPIEQKNARWEASLLICQDENRPQKNVFMTVWDVPPLPEKEKLKPPRAPPVVISKIDLEAAYYQFGVEKSSLNILAVWDNDIPKWRYYQSKCLTFGNVHSVYGFVRVTTLVALYLYKTYNIIVLPYIDDFIIISTAEASEVEYNIVRDVLLALGFRLSSKNDGCVLGKIGDPINVLGLDYTLSTEAFRMSVPLDKLKSLSQKIDDIILTLLRNENPKIKTLLSVHGMVSFLMYFKRYKQEVMYLQLLYKLMANESDPILSPSDRAKLLCLLACLKELAKERMIVDISAKSLNTEIAYLFTDAMKDESYIGLGSVAYDSSDTATFGSIRLSTSNTPNHFHIMHWEALTPLLHLRAAPKLRDMKLIIFVDNSSAAIAMAKQSCSCVHLSAIIHMTWKELAARSINVWICYINTARNPADEASRLESFDSFLKAHSSSKKFIKIDYDLDNALEQQTTLASYLLSLKPNVG